MRHTLAALALTLGLGLAAVQPAFAQAPFSAPRDAAASRRVEPPLLSPLWPATGHRLDYQQAPAQTGSAAPASPAGGGQSQGGQPATPPPPRIWSGSLSAGISITSGNKDTSNFNASFDLVRDPKKRNVFKTDALYLRGKSEKNVTGDQLRFGLYDEHRFNSKFFMFGQARYLRDRFKDVQYYVAPSTGMGYKFVDTPASSLGLSAGLGGVFEKDTGRDTETSGSLNIDQKLSRKFGANATINQSIAAIWKTDNFSDALYTLRANIAASLTQRAQVKVEVLDTFKNRVVDGTRKNDVALITALVYKI